MSTKLVTKCGTFLITTSDDASRGMSVNDLIANQRWLEGGTFLQQEKSAWPQTPDLKQIPDDDPELKQQKVMLSAKRSNNPCNGQFVNKTFNNIVR